MRKIQIFVLFFLFCPFFSTGSVAKMVIASGGASGYLVANTLASASLAVGMEADLLMMDVVLCGGNDVIVFGSPYLEGGTNVAEIFPDRKRDDGHYYAIDFSVDEIRKLIVTDPAERFPAELQARFSISTLGELLSLLRGLEKSLNRPLPLGVHLKKVWLHRREGLDLPLAMVEVLQHYGYNGQNGDLYLTSYDVDELQRLGRDLLPARHMQARLIQLIDFNGGSESMVEEYGEWVSYNYDYLIHSNSGLRSLAASVYGVGLPKYMLVDGEKKRKLAGFVENVQKLGAMVFTFPSSRDRATLLPFARDLNDEVEFLLYDVGVDGLFTDFCGDAVSYLRNRPSLPPLTEGGKESVVEGVTSGNGYGDSGD